MISKYLKITGIVFGFTLLFSGLAFSQAAYSADPPTNTALPPAAEGDEFSGGLVVEECRGERGAQESCRDVNVLLLQGIKIGRYLFSIIGAVAFFFFIFGGFTLITSMGSAEKAKKGKTMVFNAVIGMFIAFSAYLVIYFILEALGVSPEFRGITAP
jgi:hypothetical protein